MAEKEAGREEFKKAVHKISKNYWAVATMVLAVLLVIVYFYHPGAGLVTISKDAAGQKIVSFVESRGGNAQVVEVVEEGSLYQVTVLIDNQTIPVYLTKDGNNLIPSLVPLTGAATTDTTAQTQAPQDIPKTDKPSVELYVFTYCPYGTQSEKGMIPAVKLLGNKIDFKIRQIGAMHGEYEAIEAQRQLCIEKEYPSKFLDYALKFALDAGVGTCGGDATCVAPKIETIFKSLGIDKTKIENCMKANGAALYALEEQNAQSKGVGGSPTLIINGVDAQAGRDSASYLSAICSAFTEGKIPAECSTALSSGQPSPGFGSSTSSDAASAASCG